MHTTHRPNKCSLRFAYTTQTEAQIHTTVYSAHLIWGEFIMHCAFLRADWGNICMEITGIKALERQHYKSDTLRDMKRSDSETSALSQCTRWNYYYYWYYILVPNTFIWKLEMDLHASHYRPHLVQGYSYRAPEMPRPLVPATGALWSAVSFSDVRIIERPNPWEQMKDLVRR